MNTIVGSAALPGGADAPTRPRLDHKPGKGAWILFGALLGGRGHRADARPRRHERRRPGPGDQDRLFAAAVAPTLTIGAADNFGLPVSTTQVLSSGVAGTMAANQSGLQWSTTRNLAMAWVLTLPTAILRAAASTGCSRESSDPELEE